MDSYPCGSNRIEPATAMVPRRRASGECQPVRIDLASGWPARQIPGRAHGFPLDAVVVVVHGILDRWAPAARFSPADLTPIPGKATYSTQCSQLSLDHVVARLVTCQLSSVNFTTGMERGLITGNDFFFSLLTAVRSKSSFAEKNFNKDRL